MTELHRYNKTSWLDTVWDALQGFREDCISTDDELWDEICTAMRWIEEELNIDYDEDGDAYERT